MLELINIHVVFVLKYSDVENHQIYDMMADTQYFYIGSSSGIRVFSKHTWKQIALFSTSVGGFMGGKMAMDDEYVYSINILPLGIFINRWEKGIWEKSTFFLRNEQQDMSKKWKTFITNRFLRDIRVDSKYIYLSIMLDAFSREWIIIVISKDHMCETTILEEAQSPFDSNTEYFVCATRRGINVYEKHSFKRVYEISLINEIQEEITYLKIDGRFLYANSYEQFGMMWELKTWQRNNPSDQVQIFTYMDESYYYSIPRKTSDSISTIKIMDKDTHKMIRALKNPQAEKLRLISNRDHVYVLNFSDSPSKKPENKTIEIYEKHTWALIKTLKPISDCITCVCINKKYLFVGSYNTIRIWDKETGKEIKMLFGHNMEISALCADERFLISGSKNSHYILWDLHTFKKLKDLTAIPEKTLSVNNKICLRIDANYIYLQMDKDHFSDRNNLVPSIRVYDKEKFDLIATLIDIPGEDAKKSIQDIWIDEDYVYECSILWANPKENILNIWDKTNWTLKKTIKRWNLGKRASISKIRSDTRCIYVLFSDNQNPTISILNKHTWKIIKELNRKTDHLGNYPEILGVDENHLYTGGGAPNIIAWNKNDWTQFGDLCNIENTENGEIIHDQHSFYLPITDSVIAVFKKHDFSIKFMIINGFGYNYEWIFENKEIIKSIKAISNNILFELDESSNQTKQVLKDVLDGTLLPVKICKQDFSFDPNLIEKWKEILK